jgi:ABC-type sulfate/molybdate transport systems ATPase subunit
MKPMRIELQDVSKSFGKRQAISNVTLSVQDRELIVLLGASGCGKSTLLKLVAGLETPNEGVVRLSGQDVTKIEPRHRGCAMAFQDGACYDHWSVEKNILHASDHRTEIADRLIRSLELSSCQHRYPTEISGGEKQRVSLARALASPKPILLLDEPLAQLNPKLRWDARKLIAEIHHKEGKTTLYVTHDVTEAMLLGDRVAIVEQGRIVQIGKPRELFNPPSTQAAASLFGSFVRPRELDRPYVLPHCWRIARWNDLTFEPLSARNVDELRVKGTVLQCKWMGSGWILNVALDAASQDEIHESVADVYLAESNMPQNLRLALKQKEESELLVTIEATAQL